MSPVPDLEVGAELVTQRYVVRRSDLVRYAGASGDLNPIHWSDRVATEVGLPGVIAHGMYTLALAARAVATWTGDAEVVELGAKFTAPVVVPDDDTGVEVEVAGTVASVEDGLATLKLTVTSGGQKVLGMPKAVVRA
ncbi:MaoC/PaaZ C-terminal domain-containing protein [Nocardioides deserti]|uniref:MaoC family dehydratase N-terminal domain-containing protein n=1 Tax=Nocardioides deserti TaxID=1588644 RepID=A0ABR6UAD1_9ACTN|nr:MaoC/PaaZ C-terminal domain-containing protein [Nocardioides deserti]MBC2961399.1 MaoC family dehydratase N-terminal domain-containing protein [Nocardioides deserti]GGO72642.1 MaoC family dehydratase [Nocardioides deserti]